MQLFLSKYGVAAHLAMLAVSPLFLFPYCAPETVATVMLWLSAFAFPWVLLEPSRRSNEMLHEARRRVAGGLLRDPLFWAILVVLAVVAVRWANGGIALAYDAECGLWFVREPTAAALPGSVVGAGYPMFASAVALMVLLMGCRHSLGKSARASFFLTTSVLSGVAALAACAAVFFGHDGAVAASRCETLTSSFAGTGFGLYFLAGLVSLAGVFENGWNRHLMLAALSVGASASGLWFFAPAPVVLAFLAAGVLVLAASCAYSALQVSVNSAFKCLAVMLIGALVPVLCALALAPDELNDARLAFAADGGSFFSERFFAARDALSRIAHKAFAVHPWIGSGVGSFPLDVRFNATGADWSVIAIGQNNPLSGWWLLAAERGIVGGLLFALPLALLLFTLVHRAYIAFRGKCARGTFFPGIVLGAASTAVLVAETFVDGSLFRPECLMAVGAFLAISALAFPVRRQDR